MPVIPILYQPSCGFCLTSESKYHILKVRQNAIDLFISMSGYAASFLSDSVVFSLKTYLLSTIRALT